MNPTYRVVFYQRSTAATSDVLVIEHGEVVEIIMLPFGVASVLGQLINACLNLGHLR